jgi:hypothetical protein
MIDGGTICMPYDSKVRFHEYIEVRFSGRQIENILQAAASKLAEDDEQ